MKLTMKAKNDNEFKKIRWINGWVSIMRNKKFMALNGSLIITVKINDKSLKGSKYLNDFIKVKGLPLIKPRMFGKEVRNKVVLTEIVKRKGQIVDCVCWQEQLKKEWVHG